MRLLFFAAQAKDRWRNTKIIIEQEQKANGPRQGRKYLLEQNGNKCEICHNKVWEGQSIPLVIDHIDGNADNWLLSNLRLICPNCDAQTPTYKKKNNGNGRYSRRMRYKEGKSY
jgi:5-methylcytosine-specific restriction endonuclease McrA